MEHGAWSEEPEIRGQQSENDKQRITDNSVCRLPFTVYRLRLERLLRFLRFLRFERFYQIALHLEPRALCRHE